MDPTDTSPHVNDDDQKPARPASQVTVRCEPAAEAVDPDAMGTPGVPSLEEAGYGYGV